uniref:Synaptosomal-associated protein n=1 Tax=Cyprinus carpio TaxID=7962 RepID=A0A8C1GSB5_CYPCA
ILEKLKNVEKEMDQINQDMKQAQKNLNELSKCCGLCLCPFNRWDRAYINYWRKKQVKTPKESKQNIVSSQPTVVHDGQAPTGPYIKRITNNDREDEMEDNLRQVGNHVEILKNMALDFDDKIEDHIEKTANINDKVQLLLLNDKMEFIEVKCICDSRHLDLQ